MQQAPKKADPTHDANQPLPELEPLEPLDVHNVTSVYRHAIRDVGCNAISKATGFTRHTVYAIASQTVANLCVLIVANQRLGLVLALLDPSTKANALRAEADAIEAAAKAARAERAAEKP